MTIYIENLVSKGKKIISILIISGFIAEGLVLGIIIPKRGKAEFVSSVPMLTSPTIQENSLLAVSNPSLPPYSVQKLEMVITA